MKLRIPTGLGLSSLLVIFGVLCLCVFVMLSVSTMKNQQIPAAIASGVAKE